MEQNWKCLVLTLTVSVALFGISCTGTQTPVATPTSVPTAVSQVGKSLEAAPALIKEVLVPGTPDTILSNPEPDKAVNIEFILDASGSMLERIGNTSRVQIAKEVISKLVQELPPNISLGLRVYGHRFSESDKARSCEDIELIAPLGGNNGKTIADQLGGISPKGWTPMARSLELSAQDVSGKGQSVNNIVLLSDGKETCEGNPMEAAQALKESPAGVTVHTIGFAIDEDARTELKEMARVSGGTYNEAEDAQGLLVATQNALLAARSGTFLRGEVMGDGGRKVPTSLWLQDPRTGQKLHEFGSWVDSPIAAGEYDVLVGTAPRVIYAGLKVQAHTRTILKLSTGGIRIELADAQGQQMKVLAHIVDRDTGANLRDFPTWYNQSVLPGSYDVMIESNPKVVRRGVKVEAGALDIVNLRNGSLRLDVTGLGGEKPNWETELHDPESGETIYRSLVGREQTVMNGSYRAVILTVPPIEMNVTVNPGESKVVSLKTGLLRVQLSDRSGQRSTAPATLIDAAGNEVGRFTTWEDAKPLPGSYQLVVHSDPELRQQVQIGTNDPTIIKLRSP